MLCMMYIFIAAIISLSFIVVLFDVHFRNGISVAVVAFLSLFTLYLIYGYTLLIVGFVRDTRRSGSVILRYIESSDLRNIVNNTSSAFYAIIFGMYEYALFYVERSKFFLCVAILYIMIGVAKLYLVRHYGEIDKNRGKISAVLAAVFILISFALTGITVLVSVEKGGFSHRGLTIYVVAVYSFFVFVNTIISTVRFVRRRQFVNLTFLRVRQVNAMYSVYTLTVSMLTAFSTNKEFNVIVNKSVGFTAAGLIFCYAVYMLILWRKSRNQLKTSR